MHGQGNGGGGGGAAPVDAGVSTEIKSQLHREAEAGNVQRLEDILDSLPDHVKHEMLNKQDPVGGDLDLPFHSAAKGGRRDALQLLCPINKDAPNGAGMSALHIATSYGHTQAVLWLVDPHHIHHHSSGANPNFPDSEGNTALHLAVKLRRKKIAVALVEAGAALDKRNNDELMPVSYCGNSGMFDAIVASFFVDKPDRFRNGAAATDPAVSVVFDKHGRSILHYAAIFCQKEELIAVMIEEMYGKLRKTEDGELNFLIAAAEVGNLHVLKALQHTVWHHVTDLLAANGQNVAIHALLSNQRPFLDELLDMASDSDVSIKITLDSLIKGIPNEPKDRLRTSQTDGPDALDFPIYVLLYAGKFQAFEFLLDYGDSFKLTVNQWDDKHLRTCLHWAALHQRADIVEALVNLGEDGHSSVGHHRLQGWLPEGAAGRRATALEILDDSNGGRSKRRHGRTAHKRRQASPTIEDADGKTALQIGFENRDQDVLEAMRRKASFRGYEERLYKDRDVYVQGIHAILIGAALIGGVSFAGWLQLPSTEFDNLSMKIFWASNVFAFYTALAAICISIAVLVPTPRMYIGTIVRQIRAAIVLDAGVFAISLVSAGTAFGAAAFAAMSSSPSERRAPTEMYHLILWVSIAVGFFVFIFAMLFFVRQFYTYFPTSIFIMVPSAGDVFRIPSRRLGNNSRKVYPHAVMRELRGRDLVRADGGGGGGNDGGKADQPVDRPAGRRELNSESGQHG